MTIDDNDAQATDAVLDEYWAMHLRAEQAQDSAREEAAPFQQDHQQRTKDLAELNRRKGLIEQDIRAQEGMLRTVAAQLGELTGRQEQARLVKEKHAATVARIVQETGRPHPKDRFDHANRQALAARAAHNAQLAPPAQALAAPSTPEQVPSNPPGDAPTGHGSAADTVGDSGGGTGGFSLFRGRQILNGAKP
ncbi:hypothetical protein [Actinomadura sp. 3N508]|uniref:hypothetical protein n=1 Tax=Actinomadura sp. 3N508 TaxID=3375153 RepID=UPI003797D69A